MTRTKSESNGRYVTVRELNDKLVGLRWEMRAWMLMLILGVLLKFQIPEHAAALASRLVP